MKKLNIFWVFLFAVSLATGNAPSRQPPKEAIAFYGILHGGGTFDFNKYFGKTPVILHFWATWGESCDKEANLLEKVYQQYSGRLAVVSVNVQDFEETVDAFVSRHKISYPVVLDGTADLAWLYQVKRLPTTFFVDTAKKIAAVHRGPFNAEQLDHYLKLLLENRTTDGD